MESLNPPGKKITAKRVIIISFIVDLIDVITGIVVALLSGSVIIFSQFLEGVADLVASSLLLFGLYKSRKSADKSHPFGYGRELYFWTLIAALVMFGVTATLSVYFGWRRFLEPEHIRDLPLAYAVLIVTTFTNGYAFSISLRRLLKKHNIRQVMRIFYHSSLIETKTTFILDAMGTLASILGLVALSFYSLTGRYEFDGLGAIVVGIILFIFGYFLIIAIKDLLVGKSASREDEDKIKEAAKKIPQVKDVLDLRTMHIGSEKLLVNMEVQMESKLTTAQLEKLIDEVKEKIQSEVPSVKHIQVELETP